MATTTFNAMYFAGLKDIEHKPHSVYIDRYPEGREATVAWGSVDLRFQNDTDYGVLVHATVKPSDGSVAGRRHVSMYSTKTWDITSTTSDRYNFRSPGDPDPEHRRLRPHTGYDGFDVDVTRYFHKPGDDAVVTSPRSSTPATSPPTRSTASRRKASDSPTTTEPVRVTVVTTARWTGHATHPRSPARRAARPSVALSGDGRAPPAADAADLALR